jgi:hypothetical protein
MARLTQAQIARLTPEQRRKRNKTLAYIRERAASKRDGKKRTRKASKKTASYSTSTVSEKKTTNLSSLIAELESVHEREQQLVYDIQDALNAMK